MTTPTQYLLGPGRGPVDAEAVFHVSLEQALVALVDLLGGDDLDVIGGKATDQAAAERGTALFADNCAACHGASGEGNQELGAPRLNDAIWLYGGDKATIVQTRNISSGVS